MIQFKSAREFCELFSIDTERAGAHDFCMIVSAAATLRYHGLPGGSAYAAALSLMRARHWSPLVLWRRMRHDLAPAIDAGRDTLAGLGVVLPVKDGGDAGRFTVCELAAAVAAALADAGEVTTDRKTAEEMSAAIMRR